MRILTAVLFVACTAAADAADLAGHSRIGAVFADPVPRGRRTVIVEQPTPKEEPIVAYAPEVDVAAVVHGYYGKPNSYYYRNYYGTRPEAIFSRAPYGCGWYGYC